VGVTAEDIRRVVDDACAICAIAAPTGHEERRAEWVADELRACGAAPWRDDAGNVLARIGGPSDTRPLVVAAHLDTVFAGVEAIAVRRDRDVLHAPGIGDNSLGVAGLLHLARAATHADAPAGRPLVLAATVGEEGFGNLRGARAVVEALRPAEFVALEGGGVGEIVTSGVGSARYALRVTAPGGHSWRDRGKPNALHVLVALLDAVLADPGAAACNLGSIEGGAGINVLAPRAEATIELRDADATRLDRAVDRFTAAARSGAPGVAVELEELGRRPAGAVAPDHPLVRDALDAAVAAGLPAPRFGDASTDANAALGAGIPAITVGLCRSADAHTPAERIDVSDLGPSLTALGDLVSRRRGA
jgi:acetylornithine deacetylase/succinyl-diaminopimelate desuccinylase-like protein